LHSNFKFCFSTVCLFLLFLFLPLWFWCFIQEILTKSNVTDFFLCFLLRVSWLSSYV
jgi:hypothetical protein